MVRSELATIPSQRYSTARWLCQCVSEQLLHFVQTNTDSTILLRIKISPTKPLNVVIWMHSCCLNEMGLHCYFPKQNCNVSWIPAISTLIWGAATPDLRFNFRYSEPQPHTFKAYSCNSVCKWPQDYFIPFVIAVTLTAGINWPVAFTYCVPALLKVLKQNLLHFP